MEAIEERIRQAAKEEARQEANKEVMTMVGSLLAAIQTGGGAMSVMNKADAAMETGTKVYLMRSQRIMKKMRH